MTHRDVAVKDKYPGATGKRWPIGQAFVYRSTIWKVKGMYLTASQSGDRDTWWILGQQAHDEDDEGGR